MTSIHHFNIKADSDSVAGPNYEQNQRGTVDAGEVAVHITI